MPLIKPQRLRPGDTIGIVSTSSPVRRDALTRCSHFWKTQGYRVAVAPHVLADLGYRAGSAEDRAGDLMAMFRDAEVRAILPANGGRVASHLLPLLDYDAIRDNPKILLGLSDSSILTLAIHGRTGLVTFHGPTGDNFRFGHLITFTLRSMVRTLTDPAPVGQMQPSGYPWTVLRGTGTVRGRLLGGHIGTIRSLLGTPFEPSWDGALLFLDEHIVWHQELDAALTHFRLAGVFGRISGLIFGRPPVELEPSRSFAESTEDVLLRLCDGYGFPILYGVDIGDTPETLTLPVGCLAEIDASSGYLTLLEGGVA